ncbi:MAG: GDP-L-fucose synthase [Pseudohongiellaceae bacterium]
MLDKSSSIFIAGHKGMVGSAIVRSLEGQGYNSLILKDKSELDLLSQASVRDFMQDTKPDYVVLAAARVGGIHANNTFPAEFIYQNLMIEANVIHEAYTAGVSNLLFLGSSCIYPKFAEQPMQESALLTGVLESTNEPYAIAKIAGIKLCESYNRQHGTDYRSVMPTNLYGPGDNFHLENSHVIPALIRKFHDAKVSNSPEVEVWGTGKAMREFLHVDDMAAASIHVMALPKDDYEQVTEPMMSHINVGTGVDVTIRELAETVGKVVGFEGDLMFDATKPDGTPRKLMDTGKLNQLGWSPEYPLETGLNNAYEWFVNNQGLFRA